ncbi:NAD-dependent epimerase/dehydratase family protein [Sphingobacterium hungaricum]
MMITVTGASGFVGRNLCSYLNEKGINTYPLPMRDPSWRSKLNQNSDVLIHLAGKAHDTQNISDETEYFKVNRDLTKELFDYFLSSNIKDFFYFSSVKAVADNVVDTLTEDNYDHALTAYGKSKREAEKYILDRELPLGKRVFIIRPCMIHGPGNKGNLNLLYKLVEKGLPWPLAAFDNKRSFLGIDNLNYLLDEMIMNENIPSGIYNFADDEDISTNELIKVIGEITQRKINLLAISPGLIKWLVKIGDLIPIPINSERLNKLTESYVVSNCKIKEALEIENLPTTTKEGLTKTIQYFNNQKKGSQ